MQQPNKIFLGHTPKDQREYITKVFEYLRDSHPTLVIPACGHFTLAKCAIEAGYARENIYTSDISLYTSLLGYLFAGKPIDDINFGLAGIYQEEYNEITTDVGKVAYVFWLMKTLQLQEIHYLSGLVGDLKDNKEKHLRDLEKTISEQIEFYKGINYDLKDLRAELHKRNKKTLMILNPPVFAKGYSKMFDFGDDIMFDPAIEEFSWKKEYVGMYKMTKSLEYPVIWYRYKDVPEEIPQEDVIFSKEYKVTKHDYWLITKPEVLENFEHKNHVASFKRKNLKPYKAPLFGLDDEMTVDSKIQFVQVPPETALYYRDLFAHRLGNTKAEIYYLMLVDGKVYSTVGFMVGKVRRLVEDKVYENFGFSVASNVYDHTNRLLMLMISSKDMKPVLEQSMGKVNRIYQLNGFKTTCLTKYRTMKTHQGILNRTHREKLPNGLYRLQAETEFHDRSFSDTLKQYLQEEGKL